MSLTLKIDYIVQLDVEHLFGLVEHFVYKICHIHLISSIKIFNNKFHPVWYFCAHFFIIIKIYFVMFRVMFQFVIVLISCLNIFYCL
jgi:hypothetical protein